MAKGDSSALVVDDGQGTSLVLVTDLTTSWMIYLGQRERHHVPLASPARVPALQDLTKKMHQSTVLCKHDTHSKLVSPTRNGCSAAATDCALFLSAATNQDMPSIFHTYLAAVRLNDTASGALRVLFFCHQHLNKHLELVGPALIREGEWLLQENITGERKNKHNKQPANSATIHQLPFKKSHSLKCELANSNKKQQCNRWRMLGTAIHRGQVGTKRAMVSYPLPSSSHLVATITSFNG